MSGWFIEDACGPLPFTAHGPGDDTGAPAEDGHVLGPDYHLTSPYLQLYCMYTNNSVSAANSQEISIYFNKYLFGRNKYFSAYFWVENKYILA